MPGDEHLPDDPADSALPPDAAAGAEGPERTHRGEAPGLGARLAAARVKIAAVLGLLVLVVVALATGLGPGDGWGGADDAGTTRVLAPELPETPEESTTSEPRASGSKIGLSYIGLCRAYQEEAATNGDAASDPDFAALVDDAGSRAKVAEYCDKLLGDASADATATPSAVPSAQPTAAPPGSTTPTRTPRPTPTSSATQQPSPTPTATTPGPPNPTPTATGPGGKPTKTPRP